MDFTVYQDKLPMSGHEIMQRFGYGHIVSRHTGKESYAKRLYRDHYPRFHVYLKSEGGKLTFSMHIDQKQASYQGHRAHSGEYDGPLVQQEIDNLKQFIVSIVKQGQARQPVSAAASIRTEQKKPFWKFW